METKAKISDISKDFRTGKTRILFTCDYAPEEELQRLLEKDVRLRAVQWREKRSLDSNAYLWVLCDRIAAALDSTKEDVYELMLRRYGTLLYDEDGTPAVITVPSRLDMTVFDDHYIKVKESGDGKQTAYMAIKGSSKYDTAEMSRLLNGVVEEAKDLGIETLPPDELERMRAAWQPKAS